MTNPSVVCSEALLLCVRVEKEVGGMEMAHEGMIWSLAWHPLGHILCSGSNDHTRYHITRVPVSVTQVLHLYNVSHDLLVSSLVHTCSSASKFWTRNRPGDKMRDRYNLNLLPGMSEDGVEYGETHEVTLVPYTFGDISVTFRRRHLDILRSV